MGLENGNYIKACYGKNDAGIPIWIMRQAGRYLPEYKNVRNDVSFLELCRSPELIAEVVRQPIERFGFDAGILFSDILTILEPIGFEVKFPEGGPIIGRPIESPADIERLRDIDVEASLSFVLDGIRQIKTILPEKPLIGFVGSPFTLACYMIEGRGSKNFNKAKIFLHKYPEASAGLFDFLVDVLTKYLRAQVKAGVDAIQIFESWGGILSFDDFYLWSAEPVNNICRGLEDLNVPRAYFVNNVAPYLELVRDVDCEIIGIDYRINLVTAAEKLPEKAVQGNLDPAILFGKPEYVVARTRKILESLDCHNRLIFNLGHGILPETPLKSVEALVETVHNYR